MSFTAGAGTRYVVTSTTNPSGGSTVSGPFTISGTANTVPLTVSGYSLTGSNAQSMFDLSGTWNTSGTPTAIKLNITETGAGSNANSLLMDLQVGGTSRFSVRKDGVTRAGRGAVGAPGLAVPDVGWGSGTQGLYDSGAGLGVLINGGSTEIARFNSSGLLLSSNSIVFSSSLGASEDLFIRRDAANTLAQRNGVNPQTFRVYNTFTDASNYERGKIAWSSNVLQIGTEKAGTGTARSLALQTDGTTRLTLGASGGVTVQDGTSFASAGGYIFFGASAQGIGIGLANPGNNRLGIAPNTGFDGQTVNLASSCTLNWSSTSSAWDSADVGFARSAAGKVVITNGSTGAGSIVLRDAGNIEAGTTTGTKIGTATTQKLGFWNAAPIAQPTTAIAAATVAATGVGDVVAASTTFDGYTIPQIVKALRNAGLLA